MKWENIKNKDNSSEIIVPESWLHIHYYEALNILFRFENSLRVFVYVILKNELKDKWNDTIIKDTDTIKKIANMRISQAKDYGYLCYDIKSPMLYLSSGELIDIIMHDKNWKYFKMYFKAKKEIIKHKLLEIGAIRNSLAHFRPIKIDDIELIKQNLNHTLLIIDKCLNNIVNIYREVPTNNAAEWYTKIKEVKNEFVLLKLYQDEKADWIKISLSLNCHIFKNIFKNNIYESHNVSKLSVISLLTNYEQIKNNIIYSSERVLKQKNDDIFLVKKEINFIISKSNLENNYIKIYDELTSIIELIKNEIIQLSEDHLAEGKLISSVNINCSREDIKDYWNINTNNLMDDINSYDGTEFWGEENYTFGEYTTELEKYPWMPTSISKSPFPF